ncbi:hypothetical protein DFP72DRAFT_548225 [Ephemerocybe angulata]|uniref:Uncharacterized protein n=1 Tax=Ephemerocybe angulata TaxID=980116 RepID=A0A8H6HNR6_9AGAR|nr:hypothetical protein DFP72DRAFT_548225 [Tulosesus angulatus]
MAGEDAATLNAQMYMLVGFWLEAMIYGAYAILFIASVVISLKGRKRGASFSPIFFFSTISMFIMITVYTFINLYRGIRAFALTVVPPNPIAYYSDFSQWDNYAFAVIVTMLVWHADALVIYRCFIIWSRNFWVVLVPGLLLLLSFAVNTITLTAFKHPDAVPLSTVTIFLSMVYPVNLAQNILTTGLISYRIWSQHRKAHSTGLMRVSASMPLLTVIRIIIESALIFTVQQILLLILLELNHTAQVILHATLVPSIGIVFVLMTLRTHIARTESEALWSGRDATAHSSSHRPHTSNTVAIIRTTQTHAEDHPMKPLDGKVRRVDSDRESYGVYENGGKGGYGTESG